MGDSIVFVCTGNICRSPAAELMFRARMNPLSDVHVSSFGTHGVVGSGMEDRCSRAVRELGLDPGRHVARRLDAHSLDGVGLALLDLAQLAGPVGGAAGGDDHSQVRAPQLGLGGPDVLGHALGRDDEHGQVVVGQRGQGRGGLTQTHATCP